ncbi:hypothetical protein MIT9_P0212 [Methylomarinovum caldicuralii]|uniref:Uncharacterized protein n=1 Tax=Methylomarinovum caldicuralii TaxID=438856 RepID=A0AAU9BZG4_9GAMM|nr:hypothetical protein [Methylomarinovum caldicuralii]BCX80638.1 hypothetical protein MIT9_P0212 [Methylomarinovum caldicuralii]
MTVRAYVSHVASNRFRLRIPDKRGLDDYFQALGQVLAARAEVSAVEVNPRTASVLLCHDGSLDLATLARQAREQGWFELDLAAPQHPSLDVLVSQQLRQFDDSLRRWSNARLNNPSLIFVFFTIFLFRELAKGHVAPPALTLLWYLYELLNRPRS